MDTRAMGIWVKLNRLVNLLLAAAAVLAMASLAWGLDVADITPEWTSEGKRIATERAKRPANDEMVQVPAGWWSATKS